ncbi:MAG: fructosamine kinase family protein [Nitriliruptoraceae bacterium]
MTAPTTLPGGLPAIVASQPLAGGSIAEVVRATLADGRDVVVKRGSTPAELEAEGLAALAAAGAPVPAVLAHEAGTIVLEHLDGPRGDRRALGRALAGVHRHLGERFGWHRDNVIGSLPQRNTPAETWPGFYAEHRLAPYLTDLPPALAARLERAITHVLPDLLDHDVPPSLIHGDLWSGNILADRWLLDPAVCHADREVDLAMLELFGGVPTELAEGYAQLWPLDAGWQARRPALQLYHLLVHVRLFGAGYLGAVEARLDAIGA